MFVSDGSGRSGARLIFTAPAGLHSHFQLWSPDSAFVYFVHGSIPDKLDIWRIAPTGGTPERITSHMGRVTHPVLLDRRTLMYLASDSDGSGPWLYSIDVERRIPHRLTSGLDRYTSLAASANGRRLVVTRAGPKRALWRLRIAESPAGVLAAVRIPLITGTGFSPRLGPDYLLYASATGTSESIWKLANGTGTELWNGLGVKIVGGPAISPDGRYIGFSARQHGHALLYSMQADGANARIVADSLNCRALRRGRQRGSRSPRRRTITAFRASTACRSTAAPPLFLFTSTRSIPRGRPTAASLSTRDRTSAPRF
jgi:hypothetical protein